MKRRDFLQATAAAAGFHLGLSQLAHGSSTGAAAFETIDLSVDGSSDWARRTLVHIPSAARTQKKAHILVLLHGMGETVSEQRGIHAWGDRYGLRQAYERLASPPLSRRLPQQPYLSAAKLERLNDMLENQRFTPPITVCPYTPNPYYVRPRHRILDEYTQWLVDALLPTVRMQLEPSIRLGNTGIDGCSLGGYMAIEAFLRRPEAFSTFGMVQGAISTHEADAYAERLADTLRQSGPRPIHLSTSTDDPFRRANDKLYFNLYKRGIPCHLEVTPGPHNQAWLREIGTLDMLLWHSRHFSTAEPMTQADANGETEPHPVILPQSELRHRAETGTR